jgi:hypothetical protein
VWSNESHQFSHHNSSKAPLIYHRAKKGIAALASQEGWLTISRQITRALGCHPCWIGGPLPWMTITATPGWRPKSTHVRSWVCLFLPASGAHNSPADLTAWKLMPNGNLMLHPRIPARRGIAAWITRSWSLAFRTRQPLCWSKLRHITRQRSPAGANASDSPDKSNIKIRWPVRPTSLPRSS